MWEGTYQDALLVEDAAGLALELALLEGRGCGILVSCGVVGEVRDLGRTRLGDCDGVASGESGHCGEENGVVELHGDDFEGLVWVESLLVFLVDWLRKLVLEVALSVGEEEGLERRGSEYIYYWGRRRKVKKRSLTGPPRASALRALGGKRQWERFLMFTLESGVGEAVMNLKSQVSRWPMSRRYFDNSTQ
jgi:hypothetical protein